MYVQFYNFAKDNDSTARPTGNGARFDCQLKQQTNITTPVILLSPISGNDEVTAYNYCYIPKFSRYYFIRDWAWIGGAWEISLNVDVLASFKTQIGNLSCYVERAASEFDGKLADLTYPTKASMELVRKDFPDTGYANTDIAHGCYLLGVVSASPSAVVGGVAYYAMTHAQLKDFISFLFSGDIYSSGSAMEIGLDLYKAMFNPMQYIVSCMWFPYSVNDVAGANTSTVKVKLGYWDTTVYAKPVSSLGTTNTFYLEVTDQHPQAATRGEYLNRHPYTKMNFFLPPFGMVPLDTNYSETGRFLIVRMQVDYFTGAATGRFAWSQTPLNSLQYRFFAEMQTQFGVPIQLAQIVSDVNLKNTTSLSGLLATAVTEVGSALLGASVGNGHGEAPKVSSLGSTGSFTSFYFTPYIMIEHILLADENNGLYGRPLMQTKKLNTLSGFIKCATAEVTIACTEQERSQIKNLLEKGFFWE